jgi:hypothetical protein
VAVALLPFVTFGIYHLVWWYSINRELRDFGSANNVDLGTSPALSTLAVFPGGLIIVPAVVTYLRGTKRVQEAAAWAVGSPSTVGSRSSSISRSPPLSGPTSRCL